MELIIGVIADAANRSTEGKLNILGIFDEVTVESVPNVHPHAVLVVALRGNPTEVAALRVTLRDKDGESLFEIPDIPLNPSVVQTENYVNYQFVLDFTNLVLTKFGLYHFELLLDGELRYRIPLKVRQSAPEP